jgi:hypothetical protein
LLVAERADSVASQDAPVVPDDSPQAGYWAELQVVDRCGLAVRLADSFGDEPLAQDFAAWDDSAAAAR